VNVVKELAVARGDVGSPDSEVMRVLQLTRQSLLAGLQSIGYCGHTKIAIRFSAVWYKKLKPI
jgi:hypothetical protein